MPKSVRDKPSKHSVPACRIYCILARSSNIGVVFRRGPSRWVQVLRWNTRNDQFMQGQWFHGRIYERRCDVSPGGKYLVYFAAKHTGINAWTAISKLPFLTALNMWTQDHCWNGGGLFLGNTTVKLDLGQGAEHFKQVQGRCPLRLIQPTEYVRGENEIVEWQRMSRDGWAELQPGEFVSERLYDGYRTLKPRILEKHHPDGSAKLRVTREIRKFKLYETFSLAKPADKSEEAIPNARWADWDQRGRLVYSALGRIFTARVTGSRVGEHRLVIDLNANKYAAMTAPQWAVNW
jgi:hypothetical protein